MASLVFGSSICLFVRLLARDVQCSHVQSSVPKTRQSTHQTANRASLILQKQMAEKAAALDGALIEKAGRTRYLRANLMDN